MRVFLTGYSGNLGRSLARTLAAKGHEIVALLHSRAIDQRDLDPGVEISWGSLREPKRFDELLAGVEVVVHSAWDFRRDPPENYERVNVDATIALLEAAARAPVRRFVSISSVAVYGLDPVPNGTPRDEDSPLVTEDRALDAYPWAKVRLERALSQRAEELAVPLTIVRPGLLFSDDKAPAKRLFRWGSRRFALLVGFGGNHLPYIHVDDVADLVALAIEKSGSGVEVFNAVPSLAVPAARFARCWGQRHGFQTSTVYFPSLLFKASGLAAFQLKKLLRRGSSRPNVAYQARTSTRNVRYSSKRPEEILGWSDQKTRTLAADASRPGA